MTHFSQDSWEIYVRDKILQVNDVVRWLNEMALANPNERHVVDYMLSVWRATQMLEDMVDMKRHLDKRINEARVENARLLIQNRERLIEIDELKKELLQIKENLTLWLSQFHLHRMRCLQSMARSSWYWTIGGQLAGSNGVRGI